MYDVIQHSSTVIPRREIQLDGSVTTEDVTEGVWYSTNGTKADGANDGHNVFPNFTKGSRTDVQALDQITVIFGPHQANTDQFVTSPSGPGGYNVGDNLVITDSGHPDGAGLLTHENDSDLTGSSDVIGSVTTAPGNNDDLLELYRA